MLKITRILALAGLGACLAAPALGQGISVEVNGQLVSFPYARPQMIGGRVMIPLRGVLEQMGAYVSWDPSSRTVTARKADTDIEMRIGSRTARVNGAPVSLEVPAMILQGTTMVPLRFVSESLGADVQWVAATQTVRIDTVLVEPQPPRYTPPAGRIASISSFTVGAPSGYLRPGQMVHMELRGTPGADVMFVVPSLGLTKRMREDRPGEYTADWTVPDDAGTINADSISVRLVYGGEERTMRPSLTGSFPPRGEAIPPRIFNIEPDSGERVLRARPVITAQIDDRSGTGLNLSSWRLFLDGDDVTDDATFSNGMLRYQPRNRLTAGTHRVRIEIEDRMGNRATETWAFVLERGAETGEATLTHNARSDLRVGDTITFTVRAPAGSTVTYTLGDMAVNRAMRESSAGVYTATYVVRRGDNFQNVPVTARVRTPDGEVFTITGERIYGELTGGSVSTPNILSPSSGSRVGEEVSLRASSNNAAEYDVLIEYEAYLLGALPVRGTVLQRTYRANSRGELDTGAIRLTNPVGARETIYTVTITAIDRNGNRSEPATMTLRQ